MSNVRALPYKKRNAIIYARSDRTIDEILVQTSVSQKFIELNDLHLKGMYIDNEVKNTELDRVQLLSAKDHIEKNAGTVLIIASLDRLFSEGLEEVIKEFLSFLESNECHLVSLLERIDTLNNGYKI